MRFGLLTSLLALSSSFLVSGVAGYQVDIKDTDELREVCSGMYGGSKAYISLTFDPSSTGQLALVMYEWSDVQYLGAETPTNGEDLPKTYICTTSAIRSGLCPKSSLGSFILSLPSDVPINSTSVYTTGVRFDGTVSDQEEDEPQRPSQDDDAEEEEEEEESTTTTTITTSSSVQRIRTRTSSGLTRPTSTFPVDEEDDDIPFSRPTSTSSPDLPQSEAELEEELEELEEAEAEAEEEAADEAFLEKIIEEEELEEEKEQEALEQLGFNDKKKKRRRRRQFEEEDGMEVVGSLDPDVDFEDEISGSKTSEEGDEAEDEEPVFERPIEQEEQDQDQEDPVPTQSTRPSQTFGQNKNPPAAVPIYDGSIIYNVPKTGYYCVGVVPVTLVNGKRDLRGRQSSSTTTHASYSGSVLFKNTFEGQLPAAEYPKIGFYLFLSTVYALLAGGWGFLCVKYYRQLLPMQWYITGTIVFLIVEMLANQGYYRYINKHGGGSGSLAFLFVVAILNAGRNSISFFLLLIVSMGLSVVTPSLGSVMNRVRLLTAFHFVFGVLYAIGSVRVELESASLFLVLFMIFPLALTLTAFLMWTIISLNGTITHLQARKQRNKLALFKKLYRILLAAVIAVTVFFVISTLALSNRGDEDYAPKNWRYRWILLDASLAMIYLVVFSAIAWLWRPSQDNVRFAMSQELAQDEADADAEDYELVGGRPVQHGDDDFDEDDEHGGLMDKGYDEPRNGIRLGDDDRRSDLKDENVVFALEDDDSDLEGDIGRSTGEAGSAKTRALYADMDSEETGSGSGSGYSRRKTDKLD